VLALSLTEGNLWAQRLVAPYTFALVDVPEPAIHQLAPGEAIMQMLAGGVCGSDLPMFRGGGLPDPTLITGAAYTDEERFGSLPPGFPLHEVVGTVIASNSDLRVGQRVVGWAQRNNGLCERIVVEARSVLPIEDAVDPVLQIITQPLACVFHALGRIGDLSDRRVAVIGQGPIGLLFCEIAHFMGAGHVVGVDPIGRAVSGYPFGVDEAVRESSQTWAHRLADDQRPHVVIEAVGHQGATVNHAIAAVAEEGTVFCFGNVDEPSQTIDMERIQRKDLVLLAGTTRHQYRRGALARACDYVARRPEMAEAFVTQTYPVFEAEKAYESAAHPGPRQIKSALSWT
jgi:threonine dehydrogenase-like Zn-dependent dehydrogenase